MTLVMSNWATCLFISTPLILAAVAITVVACSNCGGTGTVWCRPWQTTLPCPHCKGTGKVTTNNPQGKS